MIPVASLYLVLQVDEPPQWNLVGICFHGYVAAFSQSFCVRSSAAGAPDQISTMCPQILQGQKVHLGELKEMTRTRFHKVFQGENYCTQSCEGRDTSQRGITQALPTWFPNRTRRSEPSRAAVSTTPLIWSHQNRRSSVKSMVRPLGDARLVRAMMTRFLPSKEAVSTMGCTPRSVQNNFLEDAKRTL